MNKTDLLGFVDTINEACGFGTGASCSKLPSCIVTTKGYWASLNHLIKHSTRLASKVYCKLLPYYITINHNEKRQGKMSIVGSSILAVPNCIEVDAWYLLKQWLTLWLLSSFMPWSAGPGNTRVQHCLVPGIYGIKRHSWRDASLAYIE